MEPMSSQLVSVIVVSAGTKEYLEPCLGSLSAQSYKNIEIIVIDNSLRAKALSYCAALNQGIEKSRGEFILCLNDDVVLEKDFIQEALKGFLVSEKVGMASGKILRFDKKTIDSTGLFLSPWFTPEERGYSLKDKGQFEKAEYIFGVSGSAAFYRRKMLEAVKDRFGYFDQRFAFFFEDLDLAWRANRQGWRAYYIPCAIAYHLRGGTARGKSGRGKVFARRYLSADLHVCLLKNRYLTLLKNASWPDLALRLPLIIFYDCAAWAWALCFAPAAIKKLLFPSEE